MMMKTQNGEIYFAPAAYRPYAREMPAQRNAHVNPYVRMQARRTLTMLAATLLLFLACTGLLYFKCLISATQIEICRIQDKIEQAQSEKSRLEAVHTEAVNLNTIRLSAQELGMGYPSSEQIRYIESQAMDGIEDGTTSLNNN